MIDLSRATTELVFGGSRHDPPPNSSRELLADGLVHADFDDPDWVYLVQVTQVPRVRLSVPESVVGHVEGADVYLVTASVANHLTLELIGREPAGEPILSEYVAASATWHETFSRDDPVDPPRWPAERLTEVSMTVTDDRGTAYRLGSAQAGGEDAPWRYIARFRPPTPPDARTLHLHFESPDGSSCTVDLPASTSEPGARR
ncbi:hypothetical protein CLV35_2219 [Motilibacter peucedani]|uniref:Uncharacterized protein n=1 Tax=Motilibacter peucedani TaxID=598650 RepID=A0A420XNE6_9ACTN|nr:hypothetical protein [Motilibacter peucedani]RKS73731.1 hypothetical protein CLV35_2219 [Motilibacter peucedani]